MTSTKKAVEQLNRIAGMFADAAQHEKLTGFVAKAYLRTAGRPSDSWSMGNRILMLMSGTSDARGFRQWLSVGRHVKKGSKAAYILGPCLAKARKDGDGGEPAVIVTGFRCIPVFRYEDTEGCALKAVTDEPEDLPPLSGVAAAWGSGVRYDATVGGEYGSFNPHSRTIRLCTDDPTTYFHELVHLAHSRIETLKGGQDPEQEAIAQLGACVLGRLYGHNVDGYTYKYIAGYAEDRSAEAVGRMCYRVLNKTGRILDMILREDRKLAAAAAPAATAVPG